MYTRRLNQDPLENFFGKIRQQNGNCRNPTPIQFQRSFKKLFCLGYFQQSKGANCLEEFDNILLEITPEVSKQYRVLTPDPKFYNNLKINTNDYTKLELPEKNAWKNIPVKFA